MRAAYLAIASSACITTLHVTTPATVAVEAVAPPFALTAHDGRTVSLGDELSRGPVVLVFYRGYW